MSGLSWERSKAGIVGTERVVPSSAEADVCFAFSGWHGGSFGDIANGGGQDIWEVGVWVLRARLGGRG